MKYMALFFFFITFNLSAFSQYDYGLIPQGWSKEGHFAYVVYKGFFDGLGEGTDFHLYIQDLVTDEVLYVLDYIDAESGESLAVEDVLHIFQNEISDEYKRYGIELHNTDGSIGSRFSDEIESYEVRFLYDIPGDDGEAIYLDVELLRLSDNYVKNAYSAQNHYVNIVATDTIVYKSPFENRIALVLFIGQPGWEGIPLEADIRVIGTNLKVGFQKPGHD